MQRKIFIAVNIDEKTKKFINNKISDWKDKLPVFWTDAENFHITLVYLGFVDDEQIMQLCNDLKQKLEKQETFDLEMNQFCWGPSKERPKMVWLKGEKNSELVDLREKIEQAILNHTADHQDFSPHITLGRIGKIKKEKVPEFHLSTRIVIPVTAVEIMESVSEKGRRKYISMESIELS